MGGLTGGWLYRENQCVKYGSISCSGGEAWQIQMPYGLISQTQEGNVTWQMWWKLLSNMAESFVCTSFTELTFAFKSQYLPIAIFENTSRKINNENNPVLVSRYRKAPQSPAACQHVWEQAIFLGYGITSWPHWREWRDTVKLYWREWHNMGDQGGWPRMQTAVAHCSTVLNDSQKGNALYRHTEPLSSLCSPGEQGHQ